MRARVSGVRKVQLLARATIGSLLLANEAPIPPLKCTRFLIDAVANGSPAARRAPGTLADWRTSFLGVLGTFERLERAERFGD
jgi:hypothetical protein